MTNSVNIELLLRVWIHWLLKYSCNIYVVCSCIEKKLRCSENTKATLLLLVGLFLFPTLEVEVIISNMAAVLYKIQIAIRSLVFT